MKNKLARALSIVLACSMVTGSSAITFAAPQEIFDSYESARTAENNNGLRLWYNKPASQINKTLGGGGFGTTAEDNTWQQATLPIGNSFIGANVYGEVSEERLTFNQKSLWNGGPSTKRPNYDGGNIDANGGQKMSDIFKEVQRLFLAGMSEQARSMCGKLVGEGSGAGYGAYQSWGDLYFDFGLTGGTATNYVRDLDLETAVANVDFDYNSTKYHREFFVSHPDKVLAIKFTATGTNKLNFDVKFPIDNAENVTTKGLGKEVTTTLTNDTITVAGQMQDNQLKLNGKVKVVPTGGSVAKHATDAEKLTVAGADSVVIFVSAETDYKNEYPKYRTGETDAQLASRVDGLINQATTKGYDAVKTAHIADYKNLFDRVDLDLGQTVSTKPTDDLLVAYNANTATFGERSALEVLLFQYGRYLTAASSREDDTLPSNLQGVWQNRVGDAGRVPWGSDYHMNVNLQMNYWPTYVTNMAECAKPLVYYVKSLVEPGEVTAQTYFGVEKGTGFTAHTQNNPFGWTCPGWSFSWGWSPAALPWILQNVWEYYEYTGDLEYMKENIYPLLKESAQLYNQILVWDEGTKRYVSAPTYSPEHGPVDMGNTYEQSLIWQLFDDTITASKLVGETDTTFINQIKDKQSKLKPISIGDSGQIKEWPNETTLGSIGERGHRHMSHLLGLYPGDLISVDNPEYMDAALISLRDRGYNSTGWGIGQRINTWARTGYGNESYTTIKNLLKGGIYPNLWDSHSPFQIDGNFGMTSGVAEMLLQSNMGYLNILPSLPDVWKTGSYKGLIGRGNFEVGVNWAEGKATKIDVTSKNGGTCTVQYKGLALADVKDSNGNRINTTAINDNKISFPTTKGASYTITGLEKIVTIPQPEAAEALRISEDKVTLSWSAVEGAASYQVYRKLGTGTYKLIGTPTATSFDDADANVAIEGIAYQVKAIVNSQVSEATGFGQIKDMRNMGVIDDSDSRITYSEGWRTYNEAGGIGKGFHFLEPSNNETATLKFVGTGIKVITNKHSMFGDIDVDIDGVSAQKNISLYNASKIRNQVVFEKTDLTPGLHTIKITAHPNATNTGRAKIEFDAFEVIQAGTKVSAIELSSKTGATTIGGANGKLQMVANVTPATASKDVTWSVTGVGATISETGLLTAGTESGTAVVTATAKDGSGIVGTKNIAVDIKNDSLVTTYIEESDSAIVYGGAGWGNWSDAEQHGGAIKFNENAVGATITYTFTGTGIGVMVPKGTTYADYKITLDDEVKGTFVTGDKSAKQQIIYEKKDLTDGSHTIKLEGVANGTKKKLEFDCFLVYTAATDDIVSKAALQTKLEEAAGKVRADYTATTFTALENAIKAAVVVMNNASATKAQVTAEVEKLSGAITGLASAGADTTAPSAVTNARAIGIEDTTATLIWDASTDDRTSVSYKVMQGTTVVVEKQTVTSLTLNNLTANTKYTYKVIAMDESGNAATATNVDFTTKAAEDLGAPSLPANLAVAQVTDTSAKIVWNASVDPEGAAVSYDVFVDGVFNSNTTQAFVQLNSLTKGQEYVVKVRAKDAKGNSSSFASVIFTAKTGTITSKPVTGVQLNKQSLTLKAKATETLTATVTPNDATDKTVTWSSSNSSVATVSAGGVVTAVAKGTATIKATSNSNTNISGSCLVTVEEDVIVVPATPREELKVAIDNAKTYEASKYTPETFKKLVDQIKAAEGIYADATADDFALEGAANDIQDAIGQLTEVAPVGKTGWYQEGTKWRYYVDGTPKANTWVKNDKGIWFYAGADGWMKTGWLKDGGAWYYLNADGSMKTGWLKDGGAWYFLQSSGKMKTGWQKDGGAWYFLQSSGKMKTGWQKDGGAWYFLLSSGKMKTGWQKDGGAWYFLQSSGKMKTGWLKDGGAWYFLQSSGKMKTGWLKDGGAWYYLQSSGKMKTGWVKDGASWYYLQASGQMKTGWLQIGTTWYYLQASGKMATGLVYVGGKGYYFNSNGAWNGQTKN